MKYWVPLDIVAFEMKRTFTLLPPATSGFEA